MPTTRRQQAASSSPKEGKTMSPAKVKKEEKDENGDDSGNEEVYSFEGKNYDSYQEMVNAKRKRNQDMLAKSGLLDFASSLKEEKKKAAATQRGISKRRKTSNAPVIKRKSNRLAGIQSDGKYIEDESAGKFTIFGSSSKVQEELEEPEFYRGRLNDGSDLNIQEAVEMADSKWIDDTSVELATKFVSQDLFKMIAKKKKVKSSPTSVVSLNEDSLSTKIEALAVDDENNVAKVTPDRIYSVAAHPSTDQLVVCAGDKQGYVGMWNVDSMQGKDGVHLFRPHSRVVSCLSWTPTGDALLSASYDGTVRWFDVNSQKFTQVFATYDDSVEYRGELGRGLDEGYKYWVQYCTPDHRSPSAKTFFLSTSVGTAMHVDLRVKNGKLTFHETLSEKKINSLSLHANGHTLASAGLDCTVKLWDIRKFGLRKKGTPEPLVIQQAGKSVNSAFFSPSGSTLLSTTQADSLDLTTDAHLVTSSKKPLKATKRVRHDNHTGRWLSTFMAQWHPSQDVFVVGSMRQPRTMELFDGNGKLLRGVQGEALTAVTSRCCFHPSTDKLVLVGGNSSGRVTIVR